MSSFMTISKENFPDITFPQVYVSLGMEGISPEDADKLLVKPIANEVKAIEGLKTYKSTASEGHASLQLDFDANMDLDTAIEDVRQAVDAAKGNLPADADDPQVIEINLSALPILNISMSGNIDDRVLYAVAEQLQDEIESINGVLEAPINGIRDEVLEVIVDPALMASYNLSHGELLGLVSSNNKLVAAGNIDTGAGRFAVKVPGLLETAQEILDLPIKTEGNTVVRFSDIATIQRTYMDPNSLSRVNTEPSVTIAVSKSAGENILQLIEKVKVVVDEAQKLEEWPEEIEIVLTNDQSKDTIDSLNALYNNVIFATLLVFIIIVWNLGIRTATLVGIAIPASFLAGILALKIMGITLNMVVLFALILTVGMLVDGAIVVTEYADRRMSEGAHKTNAYREAATRMSWPIIASTATTLAVFVPLLFWPGLMGGFMSYLPKTVLVTLGASLFVALIVIPAFGFLFGKKMVISQKQERALEAATHGDIENMPGLTGKYLTMLRHLVKIPGYTTLGIVALVFFIFFAYGKFNHGSFFFPDQDSGMGQLAVKARGNLSLMEKDTIVKQVEQELINSNILETMTTTVYASPDSQKSEDTIGFIQIEMIDWQLRDHVNIEMERLLAKANVIPGVKVESMKIAQGPTAANDISLDFYSTSLDDLYTTLDVVTKKLQTEADIKSVVDTRSLPGIEWTIDVDRQASSRYGADLSSIGSSIRMITNGLKVGSYRPSDADDELDIRMRYPFSGRDLDQIDELTLSIRGEQVPLANFIERKASPKTGNVVRVDGKLSLSMDINLVEGGRVDLMVKQIETLNNELKAKGDIPESVTFAFKGDQEDQIETMVFLMTALLSSLAIMMIILVTQFNSFYQMGLIMISIVLSTGGVFAGLLLTGQPLGIVMTGVGIIALAGIVVNNNIVLIDTYNVIRAQGLAPIDSVLRTCAQRLRPVMLTTVTTILGLMPMVLQVNIEFSKGQFTVGAPSSEMWTSLATTIAGGLTFATILTLVLTPCLLIFGSKVSEARAAKKELKANN